MHSTVGEKLSRVCKRRAATNDLALEGFFARMLAAAMACEGVQTSKAGSAAGLLAFEGFEFFMLGSDVGLQIVVRGERRQTFTANEVAQSCVGNPMALEA